MAVDDLSGEWVHVSSGRRYEIIALANLASTQLYKFKPTVVYRCLTHGHVWSRPISEWRMKFVKVS